MRRSFLVLVVLLTGLVSVVAQEVVFRYDGQTGREGKLSLNIPVKEGQQLLFRVASLDFQPRLSLLVNGSIVNFAAEAQPFAEQYIRVKRGSMASLRIENPLAESGMSFQLRVIKYPENPPLSHAGLVKGSISSHDPQDQDRQRIDWYPLTVLKGQRLLIGMVSKAGDARLQIEMPDGRSLVNDDYWGSDAGLIVDVSENALWWVGASMNANTPSTNFSLSYSLFVRELPAMSRILVAGAPASSIPVVLVASSLPALPETYSFVAPRAGIYQFSLASREGQKSQLRLRQYFNREIVASELRNGAGSAVISSYLRQNQKVELSAQIISSDSKGSYNLAVTQTGSAISLQSGDRLEQELKPLISNFYVYHGHSGEYVEFQMASNDFRTRLDLSDQAGQLLTWSNYYGSDFSHASQGGYYFEQTGDVVLEARGFDSADEGKFQFQVHSAPNGGLEAPRDWKEAIPLVSDKVLFTRLSDHDPVLEGHYAHEYFLDLKTSELVALNMRSVDFDCRLTVFSLDGQALFSNDDFEGSDSNLEFIAPRTGRYVVRASSWIEEGAVLNASYYLSFRRLGIAQSLPATGVMHSGRIGSDSLVNDSGRPYQEISESFHAGQRLYIVASSPDFNPRLQFLSPDGAVLDENDDYGLGSNARIDYIVRTTGIYRLRISAGGDENLAIAGNWSLQAWEIK